MAYCILWNDYSSNVILYKGKSYLYSTAQKWVHGSAVG
jgi:hypothetical protein